MACMKTMGISEASRTGISGLVSSAEAGESIAIARHGHVVAELISALEIERLRNSQEELLDALLVMSRFAADDGYRADLENVIESLGFDPEELKAALESEMKEEALHEPARSSEIN